VVSVRDSSYLYDVYSSVPHYKNVDCNLSLSFSFFILQDKFNTPQVVFYSSSMGTHTFVPEQSLMTVIILTEPSSSLLVTVPSNTTIEAEDLQIMLSSFPIKTRHVVEVQMKLVGMILLVAGPLHLH
jgi:hypothetical protein